MKIINLDDVVHDSVTAALNVIDEATDNFTKTKTGYCGDDLAYALDKTIRASIKKLFNDCNEGPAFIKLEDE